MNEMKKDTAVNPTDILANILISEAEIRHIMMEYLKVDSANESAEVNSTSIRTAAGFICSYIRNCQRQERAEFFWKMLW